MIRRPPRSTLSSSSAASDVYKRQIQVWDLRAGTLMSGLTLSRSPLTSIALTQSGGETVVVAGSECGKIHLAALGGSDVLKPVGPKLEGHSGSVMTVHAQGSTLWSGGADKTVRMWRLPELHNCMDNMGNHPMASNNRMQLGLGCL
eukprot:TRINITY_DN23664_c0_g1_i2.p2 TRINITY_DN23664_c0_g1~~TRINITY_DN23664_c0_g1_i2.p2  ORF type:complete len:146 (+),score=24.19 TRINITY_DN23664_c0_g1_i2:87-524(+)